MGTPRRFHFGQWREKDLPAGLICAPLLFRLCFGPVDASGHSQRQMTDELEKETENERIGIFPSWNWLYGTVAVYVAVIIIVLYIFTVTLDLGQ